MPPPDAAAEPAARPTPPGWLRGLPNAITVARLCMVPVLAWLAWTGQQAAFGPLLVAALVSDILDGLIARLARVTSELGAQLDSIADTALFFVAAWGLWVFHRADVAAHALAFAAVLGLWTLENGLALWRYGRLSSFHTWLSKAAGYALGIFIGSVFLFGFSPLMMALGVGVALAAGLEELVLLALLPRWTADVKGLWWVLRSRRAGAW